jgi:hypothetical protein
MMGLDGTIAEALQSEEEDTGKAAQEEAEHEALLKALDDDDEVQCAQQVDHSDEVVDLSNEVVGTRRTTDVASSSSRFNSQQIPTASQEAAWAAAMEAEWDAGMAAAEQPAQPAAAEEPARSEPPCPPLPAAAAAPCQLQEFSVEEQQFMLAALAQKRQAVEVSQIRELGDKRGAILKELKAAEEKVKMVCLSLALPCLSPALAPAWPDACMCVCVCSIDTGSTNTTERGSARGST